MVGAVGFSMDKPRNKMRQPRNRPTVGSRRIQGTNSFACRSAGTFRTCSNFDLESGTDQRPVLATKWSNTIIFESGECAHISIYIYVDVYIYIYTYIHIYILIHMHIHIHIHMWVCVCVYVDTYHICVCICMYLCMYIYIYTYIYMGI